MSNKVVPSIYRAVIDDVVAAIRPAFEDFGVDDDVLNELQSKWESKIIASRVADFDPPPSHAHSSAPAPVSASAHPHNPYALPHLPGPTLPGAYPTYVPPPSASSHARALVPPHQQVKTEHPTPANGGMGLGAGMNVRYSQYAHGQQGLPALSALGLSFPSASSSASSPPNGARSHASSPFTLTLPGSTPTPTPTPMSFPAPTAGLYRLPQTDGPAPSPSYDDEDDDEDDLEPVQGQLPRAAHPSLSVPTPAPAGKAAAAGERGGNGAGEEDDSAINSDLDDSDDEDDDAADEEGAPEGAIVFCTYDKVARVKNKWKCVLKDGMIHTGGRDYLFQRCTGEFEW
ncbi:transcription factor IIA alpha/beta subunit [Mycena albidolilacea]|uniref:Transcription initiation factor IIA large subunit n=1 Tax=Mycena albidolilacea TaxID=1033008 RepID=A0AAD7AP66_9AGAR|nr:transcription factor IIA alpha/beta subunit [Mycena albidolilacea]